LRDLFAATFFFFFGLEIDPRTLPPVLVAAAALALVTTASKVLTGYFATRTHIDDHRLRLRAGFALVPRGEFSIVIAGLGAAIEPRIGSLSAAYVLLMAIAGPILARAIR
jgi:CPA2 family monovalent cation:H+ antiporter-2